MLNVVSYKWGEKYGPEYWNVLAASVRRNLSVPHRFIVICDNDIGLDRGIEAIYMDLSKDFFDFWTKITIFRPRPFGIDGRILLLDVDTVITGSLDAVAALDGDFYTYPNWRGKDIAFAVTLMNAGSRRILWDLFVADPQRMMKRYASDEAFIADVFPNEESFPKPWIRSYKDHCSTAGGVPEECRFICFHGRPNPHEVITGRFGEYGPDRWIADYWRI